MYMYFRNEDTSLIRTLSAVPMVSGIERFHCMYHKNITTNDCMTDNIAIYSIPGKEIYLIVI